MEHPTLAPLQIEGWYALHQFFQLDRLPDDGEELEARRARARDVQAVFEGWADLGDEGWSGLYRLVGGGTDYMAIHFRSSLDELGHVERTLRSHPSCGDLHVSSDYLSVVELGLYQLTAALAEKAAGGGIALRSDEWNAMVEAALEEQRAAKYAQRRLYPRQPEDMPYACFYPMDKRRTGEENWYALPLADRARLMQEHGKTGRTYAGKVSQVILGSAGLDDWEWAVTLFAGDPLQFKAIVTDMRYDEVSAVYAEFGSFLVGRRVAADAIAEELAGA